MRRDQGYVLMLAMLVLVVLSGMGVYALRTARIDLRAAGNVRLGAQAEYVAEAALQQALVRIMTNPGVYVAQVEGGGGSYQFPPFTGVFGENDLSTYDALGYGVAIVPTSSVILSRAIDISPSVVPGYMIGSVGGTTARLRLKRIDVTSTGSLVPILGGQADQRTGSAQVRSHVMVGPL
jgi:hypothetical protein